MSKIIDFHSHILPGVDDGSASVKESIELLRMEASQGVGHVVATPHFYPGHDTPERFLRRRKDAENRLREAMQEYPDLPQVSIGAEVHFFHGISNCEPILELTIDRKTCILIEMPHTFWSDSMYRELEMIYTRFGVTPVIAHIDRYLRPFHVGKVAERLAGLPVLVQANAEFFLDKWTGGTALRMLKRDQIQLLGSDCHNLTDRKPNLGPAVDRIRRRGGNGLIDRIDQYGMDILGM